MNTIMSPSTQENVGMTDGQIEKTIDTFRAALRKHKGEFKTDAAQQAVTAKDLGSDLFAVFRGYVERFSDMIVRIASVNRSRTAEQAISATNRKQYVNAEVVAAMPKGTGDEAKVVFFKLGRYVNDADLDKEYASRGLIPADPFSLATVNEADPAFADEHPNATHWKDVNGKLCYAAFSRWFGEHGVLVYRFGGGWRDRWWFAGLASPQN